MPAAGPVYTLGLILGGLSIPKETLGMLVSFAYDAMLDDAYFLGDVAVTAEDGVWGDLVSGEEETRWGKAVSRYKINVHGLEKSRDRCFTYRFNHFTYEVWSGSGHCLIGCVLVEFGHATSNSYAEWKSWLDFNLVGFPNSKDVRRRLVCPFGSRWVAIDTRSYLIEIITFEVDVIDYVIT
ncbi:hypothetical protein Tco_1216020 [Tanacetum coccineum]